MVQYYVSKLKDFIYLIFKHNQIYKVLPNMQRFYQIMHFIN